MAAKRRRKRGPNKVRRQYRRRTEPESAVTFGIVSGAESKLTLASGAVEATRVAADGDAGTIMLSLHDVATVRRALDAFETVCGGGSSLGGIRRRAKRSDAGQPRGPRGARRGRPPGRPAKLVQNEEPEEVNVVARKGKRKKRHTEDD